MKWKDKKARMNVVSVDDIYELEEGKKKVLSGATEGKSRLAVADDVHELGGGRG